MDSEQTLSAWLPDLLYDGKRWHYDTALVCDAGGRVVDLVPATEVSGMMIRLPNQALLPGMVNAHSHAFQRVIRGRTEHRSGASRDSFWTWREMMYSAVTRLTPEDIYDASRMTFLEMALSGITTVGEFHYLHHAPDGRPYDDVNLLAKAVVQAALDVGLRIALMRVAYFRAGYQQAPDPQQARFIETGAERFIQNAETLRLNLGREQPGRAWMGVAPHSVRAAGLPELRSIAEYAARRELPLHMHVAEQPAELEACLSEHSRTPVDLLAENGILSPSFTGVHGIHLTEREIEQLAFAGANICACPTTERNLGDGIIPADRLFAAGISLSLGSDSHAQIDLLEDARELEYHLRLQRLERNVLAPADPSPSALAARLFDCATIGGARSVGFDGGVLAPGRPADFFTIDLKDPSIAGSSLDDLLANIVFGSVRSSVRDVVVGGQPMVAAGTHQVQADIVDRFTTLQKKLWS
ncbi:MAG: formimidoylglutamate deiminase [Pyrinomonadaceae bacterium]